MRTPELGPEQDDGHARFRVGVLALMVAIALTLFVMGRGPGSLVWITGAAPPWLPFAGSLTWLHAPSGDAPKPVAAASPRPPSPLSSQAAPTPPPPAPPSSKPPSPKPSPKSSQAAQPPAPSPTSSVLFSDNFEQDQVGGPVTGWKQSTGSFAIVSDGSKALYTSSSNWAIASVGSTSWSNYKVSANVKSASTTGHSRLIARYRDGNDFYACGLDHGGYLYLGKYAGGAWVDLSVLPYAFAPGQWYQVSFSVVGNKLTCTASDPSNRLAPQTARVTDGAYPTGAAGWVGEGPGYLDNFLVTSL